MAQAASSEVIERAPMLFVCGMSRSGTTLLATVFDAHTRISMGYELIPSPGLDMRSLSEALEEGLRLTGGGFHGCGRALRQAGRRDEGLFLTRCARAGLDAEQTREALTWLAEHGPVVVDQLVDRLRVAWRLALSRCEANGSELFGFKLNMPAYANAFACFPGGHFLYIVRDPRDVYASHVERGFDRTLEEVCQAWNNYLDHFERFQQQQPDRCALVRYEDLVQSPEQALEALCRNLPITWETAQLRFNESDASVHQGHHPNAEQLQKGFFNSSVGRWREQLSAAQVEQIVDLCRLRMTSHYACD